MKNTMKYVLLSVAFILILALPILHISWTGSDYSAAEKRVLAARPTVFTQEGTINQHAGVEIKNWLQDHIGFRSQFVEMAANIKFHFFKTSPSTQVHMGKDGWYYYTLDDNLKIETEEYPLSDNTLERILQAHLTIRDKLKSRGIEYVVVLPTSKVSIYPEYMRYGDGKIKRTPVDVVADYLEEKSDLHVVRLKNVLLTEKQNHQVYYKTDTHWNQRGANIAYQKIISDMTKWGLCTTPPIDVSFESAEFVGEFGAMMGITLPSEETENSVIPNPKADKNADSERNALFREILANEGITTPCYYYLNDAVDGARVMMYGDSMFGSWNATELLAENFSEFLYIWDRNIRTSLIEELNPDIVIYELTERYLNVFPEQNSEFMKSPLSDYQAAISEYTIKDGCVSVKVKNTSNVSWRWTDQVRLGLFSDGGDTGIRANLGVDSIQPGEEIEYDLDLSDYPGLLETDLEVQMLQEGICYFGEKRRITNRRDDVLDAEIVSSTEPHIVNHSDSYNFDIIVKNTGSQMWSEGTQTRLCIWQDGVDWGYRLYLPDGVVVKPGEEYTFTLSGFVLPEAESTYLEFQMLQEGVCYFGEKQRTDIHAG